MITIDRQSWHARLYTFYHKFMSCHSGHMSEGLLADRMNRPMDLCSYMRTILIYLPFTFVATSVCVFSPLIALAVLLVVLGWKALLLSVLTASLLFGGVAALVGIVMVFEEYLQRPGQEKATKGESFTGLSKHWVVAKKRSICPFLKFNEENSNANQG